MPQQFYDWSELAAEFSSGVQKGLARWVAPDDAHYEQTLAFALGRLEEGRQLSGFFAGRSVTGRVLDLGAGNGGVAAGMANDARFQVTTLDIIPNRDVVALRRNTRLPIAPVVGTGHYLPFAGETFDIVLCLETIEHVPRADLLGPEIARVLKPGGVCMLTTPPRLRYFFQPDPHYGIRGLLLFPDSLQKYIASRLLRRTNTYDVTHIYWSVAELARLFPTLTSEVLWNRPFPLHGGWRDKLWFRTRNLLWDRILLHKRAE